MAGDNMTPEQCAYASIVFELLALLALAFLPGWQGLVAGMSLGAIGYAIFYKFCVCVDD